MQQFLFSIVLKRQLSIEYYLTVMVSDVLASCPTCYVATVGQNFEMTCCTHDFAISILVYHSTAQY